MRELAIGARAAIVFPDYSLSPEAKYPTAIEECYSVVKWAAEHGREYGMDPQRLAVAGDQRRIDRRRGPVGAGRAVLDLAVGGRVRGPGDGGARGGDGSGGNGESGVGNR